MGDPRQAQRRNRCHAFRQSQIRSTTTFVVRSILRSENWLGVREFQTHIFGRAASAAIQGRQWRRRFVDGTRVQYLRRSLKVTIGKNTY